MSGQKMRNALYRTLDTILITLLKNPGIVSKVFGIVSMIELEVARSFSFGIWLINSTAALCTAFLFYLCPFIIKCEYWHRLPSITDTHH